MNIVFLSGKGGTGKTTVSTNIAYLNEFNYFDCDVEEPNGHIFLKPTINKVINSGVLNPIIDDDKCTLCNECVKNCQFGALVNTGKKIMVFNELCHGCGTCSLSCKFDAITEVKRTLGKVEVGTYEKGKFVRGILNIKEPLAVPVIKDVKVLINRNENNIIDSPPGTSCTVVETLEDMDYAVLVTEPTKFGLSDLKMAVSVVREMKIPFGIIINRSSNDDHIITDYLESDDIDLIGKIPYSMKAARLYSKGIMLISDDEFNQRFRDLSEEILKRVEK
ncbi:MAG: ATP-binding protein [Bacillota bacterium]|nr:ATP-binding protein [Bacillota bacterium]